MINETVDGYPDAKLPEAQLARMSKPPNSTEAQFLQELKNLCDKYEVFLDEKVDYYSDSTEYTFIGAPKDGTHQIRLPLADVAWVI